jgi:hypothetical protein
MDKSLDNLRATKVKLKDLNNNGVFNLQKNTPKMIDKNNNKHIARIDEEKEQEVIFIHSEFDDESAAMIGNEFCLNFLKNSQKTDFSYYYFSEDKKVIVYLYDMKKTFAGIDVIIHLIEQWQNSIRTACYCIDELQCYKLSAICIGVITEDNDCERRTKEIESIMEVKKNLDRLPSFMQSQYYANNYDKIKKAKIFDGFLDGKITILGNTYEYSVITFDDNKECHLYFHNGILKNVSKISK